VLQGLGVRELEPLDVMHGYILPSLTQASDRAQQPLNVDPVSTTDLSTAAAAQGIETATAEGAARGQGSHKLAREQQLHLMRLLAFPLAASLLDAELGAAATGAPDWQQQLQQAGSLQGLGNAGWSKQLDSHSTAGQQAGVFESSSSSADKQAGTLLAQLAQVAVLVTSTGRVLQVPSSRGDAAAGTLQDDSCLFLPKHLGSNLDLPQLFPSHAWPLVSPDYASCCSGVTAQQWMAFMQALGVQTFLPVGQQTVELTWKQLMVDAQYAAWRDAVDRMDDSVRYVFNDWHWRNLQRLLDSIASDADPVRRTEQLRNLSRVVSGLWQSLVAAGHLQCGYSVRSVVASKDAKAAGKPSKGSDLGVSSSSDSAPQQQRRRHAAGGPDGISAAAGSSKVKGLSAGAAAWQPGKQKLPSSVLTGLQSWSWVLASDGKAHPPTKLFFRQQVRLVASVLDG
jgi:hypothetical protein